MRKDKQEDMLTQEAKAWGRTMLALYLRVTPEIIRNDMTKGNSRREGLIWLPYPESESTEGSQGRDSNQTET